ncbi:MAG: DUF2975 domain-containing protein [Sphingomonas sp.]|nr:DUF2975 domain-containing protein [Sphingomonas sp.]
MLSSTKWLLRLCNILNWIAVVFVCVGMVVLIIDPAPLATKLAARFGGNDAMVRWSFVAICALVVPAGIATNRIFTRLIAMIDTVVAGSTFHPDNVGRIQTIAWAMLVLQLLDLVFGAISLSLSKVTGDYFGWSPSFGGWLSVLLLFVLALVFRHGAEIQADLEGTV